MSGKHWTGFNFVDLYAGIGGNRLALKRAGGRCLLASEPDEQARQVYSDNFGEAPVVEPDASDVPSHELLSAHLHAAAYSLTHTSSRHDNVEGQFQQITDIIRLKQPKAFLLQGSPSLQTTTLYREFKETLKKELGYHLSEQVIDASRIVPQRHRRLYAVGIKEGSSFQFPEFEDFPMLGDVLEAGVDPRYTLSNRVWAHVRERVRGQEADGGRPSSYGYVVADLDAALRRSLSVRTVSEVLIPQGEGANPRRLTPRECARLMGFPDSFILPVPDSRAYALLSHSPVVPVVERIACAITKHLAEEAIVDLERGTEKQEKPWRGFENRVAQWLRRVYGYNVESPVKVKGGVTVWPYDVDVYAWKNAGLVRGRVNVWVECKQLSESVKRDDVFHLIQRAKEVRDGGSWNFNILMIAAEGGFNFDTVKVAEKYKVYLVNVSSKGYQFVGKMSGDDFTRYRCSEY